MVFDQDQIIYEPVCWEPGIGNKTKQKTAYENIKFYYSKNEIVTTYINLMILSAEICSNMAYKHTSW